MNATHVFTNTRDINNDQSVFTGLRCTLLQRSGMDRAGYDCEVALHCTFDELLARYRATFPTRNYTLDEMYEYHGDERCFGRELLALSQGLPVICANLADDLTAIEGVKS